MTRESDPNDECDYDAVRNVLFDFSNSSAKKHPFSVDVRGFSQGNGVIEATRVSRKN